MPFQALRSARRRVLCSRIISAYSVLNSRRAGTSSSAYWRRSALKRDVVFCLLTFLLVLSASVLDQMLDNFRYQQEYVLYCALTLLSSFYVVPYTGIRTFVIVATSEHGKLEY